MGHPGKINSLINLLSVTGIDSATIKKMDAFSYHNIFETKGIEYLVVIAFLVLIIPFWIMLNKKIKITVHKQKASGILTATKLKIPQGIYYSRNHAWAYLKMSGIARVGLDDLLLHLTGDIHFKDLRNRGEEIKKDDVLAEIEHKGKSLRIFSPVSGEILSMNPLLYDNPGSVSEDPYLNGWMYEIRPARWTAETNSYYMAEDATKWLGKELERFKDFLAGSDGFSPESARLVLQDGGELTDHTLSDLPAEVWQNFQNDFLNPADTDGKHI
jgi:glycine cleavage system H protein